MTLEIDSLLHSRYRIKGMLGQGGMGAIYHAVDESLGVEVAVKENLFPGEEYTRQFRHEASILAGLRHPNLPRVTDHFTIENQGQYLVMDYIEGEDLRQRMTRLGTIPEDEAILIGIAISDALIYLHALTPQVLHRDIKPGNIKITPKGQVYLVDFGLAKVVRENQGTTTGAQAYTPGYAPPEQYGKGTSPRSDIYSLGATLYASLSAAIPEDGLGRLMKTAELTPLKKHAPKISNKLAETIEKAMAVNPHDRFQSAAELKQALLDVSTVIRKQATETTHITVAPPPTTKKASGDQTPPGATIKIQPTSQPKPLTKPRTALLVGLGGLGLLLGGIAVIAVIVFLGHYLGFYDLQSLIATTNQTGKIVPSPGDVKEAVSATLTANAPLPTVTQTNNIAPTETAAPTVTFTPVKPAIGGGTGEIAYSSNQSGIPEIWITDINGGKPRQLTDGPDGACQPDWSPDGSQIVFITPCTGIKQKGFERNMIYKHAETFKRSSLFVINADGSNLHPLFTSSGGDFDPAWSPDGKSIAFASLRDGTNSRIYLYDIADNKFKLASKVTTTADDYFPAWSPDGKALTFTTTQTGTPNVFTVNIDGSARMPLIRDTAHFFMPAWSPLGDEIMFSISDSAPRLAAKKLSIIGKEFKSIKEDLTMVYGVEYSPDGSWLTFEAIKDGVRDIYIMRSSGTDLKNLIQSPADDIDPDWRPLPARPQP